MALCEWPFASGIYDRNIYYAACRSNATIAFKCIKAQTWIFIWLIALIAKSCHKFGNAAKRTDVNGHKRDKAVNVSKHKDGLLWRRARYANCLFFMGLHRFTNTFGPRGKGRDTANATMFSHIKWYVWLYKHRYKFLLPFAFVFLFDSFFLFCCCFCLPSPTSDALVLWHKHSVWFKWFCLYIGTVSWVLQFLNKYTCKRL